MRECLLTSAYVYPLLPRPPRRSKSSHKGQAKGRDKKEDSETLSVGREAEFSPIPVKDEVIKDELIFREPAGYEAYYASKAMPSRQALRSRVGAAHAISYEEWYPMSFMDSDIAGVRFSPDEVPASASPAPSLPYLCRLAVRSMQRIGRGGVSSLHPGSAIAAPRPQAPFTAASSRQAA